MFSSLILLKFFNLTKYNGHILFQGENDERIEIMVGCLGMFSFELQKLQDFCVFLCMVFQTFISGRNPNRVFALFLIFNMNWKVGQNYFHASFSFNSLTD